MSTKQKLMVIAVVLVVFGILAFLPMLQGRGGADRLKAGFDSEFLVRPDGYPGLQEAYDLQFASEPKHMDPGLMYKAVADGAVDVICGFATDGRIPAYDLVMLEDNKSFFPPYEAAPLVRAETLRELPQLRDILSRLGGCIDDETMRTMNYEVDENGRPAAEVARAFLVNEGLIDADATAGDGSAGSVAIGGKNFTEQEILGELMGILIECSSDIAVNRRLNLGGTMICFNALRAGDLDLYAEYTGTGLVSILKRDAVSDSGKAYRLVEEAFDEQYDLVWLDPLGFDNTYALTVRRDMADELGLETISDLAQVIAQNEE